MSCIADGIHISAGAAGRATGSSPVGREHEEPADSGVLAKDRNERQVLHRVSIFSDPVQDGQRVVTRINKNVFKLASSITESMEPLM